MANNFENTGNKLRVVHIVTGVSKTFTQEVDNENEAHAVYNAIADTMLFAMGSGLITDYSNSIFVEMYDEEDEEWVDYYNEAEDMEWRDYVENFIDIEEN